MVQAEKFSSAGKKRKKVEATLGDASCLARPMGTGLTRGQTEHPWPGTAWPFDDNRKQLLFAQTHEHVGRSKVGPVRAQFELEPCSRPV